MAISRRGIMSLATLELKKEVGAKGFRAVQRGFDPTEPM